MGSRPPQRRPLPARRARSAAKRTVVLASLLFSIARAARTEPVVVVAQGFYESPQLFAPAIYVVRQNPNGRLQFSQVGWTTRFEGERAETLHWSLAGAIELTPLRAQSSNLFYEDGREDDSRDFRDTALIGTWGLSYRAENLKAELRYLVLKHWLAGLRDSDADMWRMPYTGADFVVRYENLSGSDVYRTRLRGFKAEAHAQALLGKTPFALADAWISYGARVGPLFVLGAGRAMVVSQPNLVSRFLLGGSFDAQGTQALFGHPFAEYRVERAVTGLIRLDLEATPAFSLGLRAAAAAMPEGPHHGEAAVVYIDRGSVVLGAGLGVPDLDATRWNVFANVTAASFL